ncbi:hypothetical protein LIER_38068 [Lithospermum erythrorhizon]|uniref:Uncharacterized protein n=1 Tax=Lithospermum erythrorhizon TaxID=34254 RepID=A0AAV3PW62_LITER
MGRGVSAGGGQSSLGYLFGNGESTTSAQPAMNAGKAPTTEPSPPKPAAAASPASEKGIPAGVNSKTLNNYHRTDGQNCGNFLTERPSTKVHAAPGGGSSLGYLFGDGSK